MLAWKRQLISAVKWNKHVQYVPLTNKVSPAVTTEPFCSSLKVSWSVRPLGSKVSDINMDLSALSYYHHLSYLGGVIFVSHVANWYTITTHPSQLSINILPFILSLNMRGRKQCCFMISWSTIEFYAIFLSKRITRFISGEDVTSAQFYFEKKLRGLFTPLVHHLHVKSTFKLLSLHLGKENLNGTAKWKLRMIMTGTAATIKGVWTRSTDMSTDKGV